jgi:CHASE2 domain-containing sensor protein
MLLVFYGPTASFVSWLSVTNANVFNTGGASCVMPLSAAGKLLMGLWVPMVVVAELFLTFCIHITYWYFRYYRADT